MYGFPSARKFYEKNTNKMKGITLQKKGTLIWKFPSYIG